MSCIAEGENVLVQQLDALRHGESPATGLSSPALHQLARIKRVPYSGIEMACRHLP